jgi:opacity protein-like surface antigen
MEHPSSSGGRLRACSKLPGLVLAALIILLFPDIALSQKDTDFGVFGGASYYMGDINTGRHFYSPSPAFGGIVRYRFNPRHSVRVNGIYGTIRGDDADFRDAFQQQRLASFRTSYIDFSAHFEFNFIPYKIYYRKDKWSPYITGGIGYNYVTGSEATAANGQSLINAKNSVILSYGGGFKLTLGRRWAAGTEWTVKKTFSDAFDGLENPVPERKLDIINRNFHNKDWYSLVGIFVTYKLWEVLEDCPAYDQSRESWKKR